jgi:hypothetical protein
METETTATPTKKPFTFHKALLVTILGVAPILALFLFGLPPLVSAITGGFEIATWPFLILIVVQSCVFHMNPKGFLLTAAAGFLGMVGGWLTVLFSMAGLAQKLILPVFLVCVVIFVALQVDGKKLFANVMFFLMFNIVLNIVVHHENYEELWPSLVGYVLGALFTWGCCAALAAVMGHFAKKKAAAAAEAAPAEAE